MLKFDTCEKEDSVTVLLDLNLDVLKGTSNNH